jgi:caffeoyl-CoA O-methyltransferase
MAVPRMVTGGILVADNAISHQAELRPMLDRAVCDERVDVVLVPIGTGDLICRKR